MSVLSHRELANGIRALSMDAVEQAKSGHPGMPMGMADIAEVLWNEFLVHAPTQPTWVNRDRFVLSNGHGSMLLYSLLHLTGYDLSIDDLKNFRQLHSKTPGHPEYGMTPGVETTTGPLGQGLANAVGMALAERTLAKTFNKPGLDIVSHHTYCFVGDGCLMEGISHEVASFAGMQALNKLVVFWDDNGISIDGKVTQWWQDETILRFESYGWLVIKDVDGHDAESVKQAIITARAQSEKPVLICCKTTIGFGAPNLAGSEKSHGAPLGPQETAGAKQALGWTHPAFVIPEQIYQAYDAKTKGEKAVSAWADLFARYQAAYPELAAEFIRRIEGNLPKNWSSLVQEVVGSCQKESKSMATREASKHFLNLIGGQLPELLGGSADLTHSNLTFHAQSSPISPENPSGNYIYYGVREFGMCAMMNGAALHGGYIPYGGTFLVFLDYARNAVRMAALMHQRAIYVFTHDSIGLGEDGPTHQPIEHLAMLRATPNMRVWRPCDTTETMVAWQAALEHKNGPTALILSRQKMQHQVRSTTQLANTHKGGYVLSESNQDKSTLDLIFIATGSEVDLCIQAQQKLAELGYRIRVVSMPCIEVFKLQNGDYQESVLPATCINRIAVEAASSLSWHQFVGLAGKVVSIDRFGESAPAPQVFETLGFTAEKIVKNALELISQ
jgi:transketolase